MSWRIAAGMDERIKTTKSCRSYPNEESKAWQREPVDHVYKVTRSLIVRSCGATLLSIINFFFITLSSRPFRKWWQTNQPNNRPTDKPTDATDRQSHRGVSLPIRQDTTHILIRSIACCPYHSRPFPLTSNQASIYSNGWWVFYLAMLFTGKIHQFKYFPESSIIHHLSAEKRCCILFKQV